MSKEYYVSKPCTFMYLLDNKKCEVTDELVYGTNVFLQEDFHEEGLIPVKTNYGYSGYIESGDILQKNTSGKAKKYIVTSPFCDFYEYPEYRFSPLLTLPRGSVIEAEELACPIERFRCFKFDGKTFFAASVNIKESSTIYSFESEEKKRQQIIKTALSYLDTPYRWGGKSTFGIDCSGLCFMSYSLCGLSLYRDAVFDRRYVRKIPFESLLPADLIYYNGHITMFLGKEEYIHSSATLGGVKIGSFNAESNNFYPRLSSDIVCCARSIAFE